MHHSGLLVRCSYNGIANLQFPSRIHASALQTSLGFGLRLAAEGGALLDGHLRPLLDWTTDLLGLLLQQFVAPLNESRSVIKTPPPNPDGRAVHDLTSA